jgi:hypothetical protein
MGFNYLGFKIFLVGLKHNGLGLGLGFFFFFFLKKFSWAKIKLIDLGLK